MPTFGLRFVWAICAVLCGCNPPQSQAAPENRQSAKRTVATPVSAKKIAGAASETVRTMIFPRQSLGALYIVHINQIGDREGDPKAISLARGAVTVTVPAGAWLQLRGNGALMTEPQLLDSLPPDCLDSFEISATPLDETGESSGDEALRHLARFTGLKHLALKGFEPSDLGLSRLTTLKRLQHLHISVGKSNGTCFKDLARLPDLVDFAMGINSIKNENLAPLSHFPKLRRLIFHRCQLNPLGIQYISQCPHVTDLAVSFNPLVDDSSMKDLARMKGLEILDLRSTAVTMKGLNELRSLPHLRNLKLSGKQFSPKQRLAVHSAFPLASVQYDEASTPVDKDTSRLFAPLPK